ncbi:cytochrome P450 18a1 [Trichonephila inaurata madagascariensis]|uniref:Cytochrome P450 18a1 n=1 Tax=Trichonephila inaurata madagascariensis TaxID=2747483 RepID=A0A8X6YU98_9ARAC|nr:cytochrome P450 18a1 [Trichonephila inaurata madagascariensis]
MKKQLPGPIGLPIVGYIPFMTRKPYIKLTELSKTYGPIYKVQLGSINMLIITDYELMKEAFSKDAFMGRPPDLPFELSDVTIRSGAFNEMPWKEQRRFSMHMLRELGFGKTKMEEHLKEEIQELLQRMTKHVGKPTKLSDLLAPSMSNNIASLLFGNRLKYDDPQRKKLDQSLRDIGRLVGATSWQIFFPSLSKFLNYLNVGGKGKLSVMLNEVKDYCRKELKEHEETLDPNNIRDFMDGYLLEIQKKCNDPNTTFKKEVLLDLARAFFGAGSDTVRVTVDWMLLVSAAYPQVQKRIQAEIDEVIGPDRFPTWQDRLSMPFTEAAIIELMRWRTIVPLNAMRYTLHNSELNGYFIPKHMHVLGILWAVDHDTKLWGNDVDEYKPERMLSEDGKRVVKPEHAIPFSVGKRSCPGKSFAEVEVFLYLVAILQKFEISAPSGKEIDLEADLGISLQPRRQDLCLKLRH